MAGTPQAISKTQQVIDQHPNLAQMPFVVEGAQGLVLFLSGSRSIVPAHKQPHLKARMEWLLNHLADLSATSVHLTLFGILLACGLGLPIPEDISLISAGYLAHLGVVNVHQVFVVCFVAVLVGDFLAFGLGHFAGKHVLQTRWAQRHFTARKQRRVRAYFRKFGSKVIFVARFLPGVRFSIFFSAGCMHLRPSVFFIYDTLAAILSVPALVYLAWHFGEHIDHVISWARRSEYGIAAVAAIVTALVLFKIWKRRRADQQDINKQEEDTQSDNTASPPVVPSTPVEDNGR